MKILILSLFISTSSMATTIVAEKTIIGRSFRSCIEANEDLRSKIKDLSHKVDISKIIISDCDEEVIVRNHMKYTQKATVHIESSLDHF